MRKMRKKQMIRETAIKNLTYIRLKSDLAAIEKEMADNEPVQKENTKNIITKVISAVATEVANGIRRKNTIDLSVEKERALANLSAFEKKVSQKELELSGDIKKFKTFIDKKLFKGDKYDMNRKQFALSFILGSANDYLRSEESLKDVSAVLFDDEGYMSELYKTFENNFYGIQKKAVDERGLGTIIGMGIWSLCSWSIIPIGIGGMVALIRSLDRRQKMEKAFENLSKDELHAYIAMKLTLVESSRHTMPEREWKELIDGTLKYIGNLRGDAEYEWLIERLNAPTNKEKIELSNLAVERLSKIIGI